MLRVAADGVVGDVSVAALCRVMCDVRCVLLVVCDVVLGVCCMLRVV